MAAVLALLVALQIADLWTTSRFPRGSGQEKNPLAKWAWERFGFGGLIVGKVAVTAGVIAYAFAFPGMALIVVGVACALLAFVVVGNLMVLDVL